MTSLRWSSIHCPRKAALEATVPADREPTDREQRILFRGQELGRSYAKMLKAKYGPNSVWCEVRVKWAYGTGHMDIFLRPTRTAIEILSSKWATDDMVQRKLLQLVGYMEGYPRADNGCLIVLDPSDLSEDRWPVAKDTDTYRGLVEEMHARIAQLDRWAESGPTADGQWGELPPRVCRKPSDAIGHFCRHADTCFDGWEPPEPASMVNTMEAETLAWSLSVAKQSERAARAALADAEGERKTYEAELAALPGVDGVEGDIQIGPFVVKRVHVRRSPSLDVKKARLAGCLNEELLAEFMRPGADYWTTAIERVAVDSVDFGDEAPWTDEDVTA